MCATFTPWNDGSLPYQILNYHLFAFVLCEISLNIIGYQISQPLSVLPLSIWSWQETIKGVFSGKVAVVDVYPNISVSAVNVDVPLPSVVALTEYVRQPSQRPAFTRRNVFLRDEYTCQYCKKRYMTRDLSLDHVTPRCVGGRLEW